MKAIFDRACLGASDEFAEALESMRADNMLSDSCLEKFKSDPSAGDPDLQAGVAFKLPDEGWNKWFADAKLEWADGDVEQDIAKEGVEGDIKAFLGSRKAARAAVAAYERQYPEDCAPEGDASTPSGAPRENEVKPRNDTPEQPGARGAGRKRTLPLGNGQSIELLEGVVVLARPPDKPELCLAWQWDTAEMERLKPCRCCTAGVPAWLFHLLESPQVDLLKYLGFALGKADRQPCIDKSCVQNFLASGWTDNAQLAPDERGRWQELVGNEARLDELVATHGFFECTMVAWPNKQVDEVDEAALTPLQQDELQAHTSAQRDGTHVAE